VTEHPDQFDGGQADIFVVVGERSACFLVDTDVQQSITLVKSQLEDHNIKNKQRLKESHPVQGVRTTSKQRSNNVFLTGCAG
jgi:hypothetical protein